MKTSAAAHSTLYTVKNAAGLFYTGIMIPVKATTRTQKMLLEAIRIMPIGTFACEGKDILAPDALQAAKLLSAAGAHGVSADNHRNIDKLVRAVLALADLGRKGLRYGSVHTKHDR